MSTVSGLPAHVLLVHFIVVLAPLTAILATLCALWPAARTRLIWLVLVLALITTGLTPVTIEAGEWFEHRIGETPAIELHAQRGDIMLYFMLALLASIALLVVQHIRIAHGAKISRAFSVSVTVIVLVASGATLVQTYLVGDSGARATWGGLALEAPPSIHGPSVKLASR